MTSLYGNGASPPLIVRVAGLPAEIMEPFSHSRIAETVEEGERLRKRLDEMRSSLVDCLYGAIKMAAREERRFLLSVKRSCFNAGDLRKFLQDPQWPTLARIADALVHEIVSLESAVEETEVRLNELYGSALRKERESILRLLANQDFVRGVALASLDVAQNLERLNGKELDSFGRREKKLCLTLLRYASRAALKLSPFSTLTRTGIALATGDAPADFEFLPEGTWKAKSTISLRRELLEQCSALLLRCRTFAEGMQVAVNETLAHEGDGNISFLRPSCWKFDDENRAFSYRDPSLVTANLEGALVLWLDAELRDSRRSYRQLLDRAQTAFGSEDAAPVTRAIDDLLDIGFLTLTLPWDFSEPDLERKLLEFVDTRPDLQELGAFRDRLRELTRLLDSYTETSSPSQLLGLSKRGVEQLFGDLAPPAGINSRIEFKAHEKTFEESVFLRPERGGGHEIARLSKRRVQTLLSDLDPLGRLINLHSSVHDLLYTLAALGESRWRGAKEVGLLAFFRSVQPLFHEYLRYRTQLLAKPVPLPPGFNPLKLECLRRLNSWREQVEKGLNDCFLDVGPEQHLCPRSLADLLDQVPAAPARSCAFCAFVQPLDPYGEMWVLNALSEGFGRLGSRFTLGMDDDIRANWTSSFTPLSFLDLDGEPAELVDMTCPGHRTINVHIHQTWRVLRMPGEHPALPPERLLRLSDLRIRLRGPDLTPVLTDATCRRLIPVPLGSMAAGGRPTLLKFLSIFGSREFRRPLPTRAPRMVGGVRRLDRHIIGQTVYSREKWTVKAQQLLSMIGDQGELAAYREVNRWRLSNGIPEQVFVHEPIVLTGSLYRQKPQYIDFSSPSFIQIFRSILKAGMQTLTLEEAFPAPKQFPLHQSRWAVEVQLESFACVAALSCSTREISPGQERPEERRN